MEIKDIRDQIDQVDDKMLALFIERMGLCEEAAAYKQAQGLPLLNREREREVLAKAESQAGGAGAVRLLSLRHLDRTLQSPPG